MSYYIHPSLVDKNSIDSGGTVLDLEKQELVYPPPYAVGTSNVTMITDDFERYFKDLARMTELRMSLKIPHFMYAAASFWRQGYDTKEVGKLIAWARKRYETRWWVNLESASLLICIADPELGEDAGWDFYQRSKSIPERRSFHYPAWWEFCMHGTLIPPDWYLGTGPTGLVTATSPDKKYGMVIGGV